MGNGTPEAELSNASCRLGYQHLTEEQREAVIHFVGGEDVFVSLPTYWHVKVTLQWSLSFHVQFSAIQCPGAVEHRKDGSD